MGLVFRLGFGFFFIYFIRVRIGENLEGSRIEIRSNNKFFRVGDFFFSLLFIRIDLEWSLLNSWRDWV